MTHNFGVKIKLAGEAREILLSPYGIWPIIQLFFDSPIRIRNIIFQVIFPALLFFPATSKHKKRKRYASVRSRFNATHFYLSSESSESLTLFRCWIFFGVFFFRCRFARNVLVRFSHIHSVRFTSLVCRVCQCLRRTHSPFSACVELIARAIYSLGVQIPEQIHSARVYL